MSPVFGAAAMSLSSFTVCMNALRLNLVRLYKDKPAEAASEEITSVMEDKGMTKTLKIEGMMCGHCEASVKKALEAIDGVESAVASHKDGTAVVTLSKDVDTAVLAAAVEAQDYKVTG